MDSISDVLTEHHLKTNCLHDFNVHYFKYKHAYLKILVAIQHVHFKISINNLLEKITTALVVIFINIIAFFLIMHDAFNALK